MKLTQTQLFHLAMLIIGGIVSTLTIGTAVGIALYIIYQAAHLHS